MTAATGNPVKDVWINMDDRKPVPIGDLTTDEEQVLLGIKSSIGSEQVTRRRLDGVPF